MTVPNQSPNPRDDLGGLVADMERELSRSLPSSAAPRPSTPAPARPAPPPGTSPGGFAKAGAGAAPWGPTNTTASPLQALHAAVETAYQLHALAEALMLQTTGEKRQNPIGPRPAQKAPLLPQVSALASEIEVVLNETGRLLDHLRKQIA
jgi:hypothetical protein